MHRNKSPGGGWIVKQLIERDQLNHHYRRLNGARSHLQLNKVVPITSHRLSRSTPDINFEDGLRTLERRVAYDFNLDTTPPLSSCKKKLEIFDQSLDVMSRHSRYFSQPEKQFTPRLVQKIVQPVHPLDGLKPRSLSSSRLATRSNSRTTLSTRQKLNTSNDSAFDDDNNSTPESGSSDDFPLADFKKWLQQQEEEHNYLKLICDVTADLLQRKLCTNGKMKEIIAVHIKKSRRLFSASPSNLMKKLCDDLKIPIDSSSDEEYYGNTNKNKRQIEKKQQQRKADADVQFQETRTLIKQLIGEDIITRPVTAPRSRTAREIAPTEIFTTPSIEDMDDDEVEAYLNDSFANDTDDDIEEEFDFD